MKIQCSVCEASEAKVLCCADDAALCWECDEKVHAANKLAGKHQRVPLSSSGSHMPKCDICQESFGYFFCLEDRALLCRKCDVAIHTANSYVSTHQRFLLAGIRVGLEATEPGASSSSAKLQSEEKRSDTKSSSASRRVSSVPELSEQNEVIPSQGGGGGAGQFPPSKGSYGGGSTPGDLPNCGKPGDCDSPGFKSGEEEIDDDEDDDDDCFRPFSDSSWMVPQIPSPPTAAGLNWPEDTQYTHDNAMFVHVPDICFSDSQQFNHVQNRRIVSKRRRQPQISEITI